MIYFPFPFPFPFIMILFRHSIKKIFVLLISVLLPVFVFSQTSEKLKKQITKMATSIDKDVINLRRHFHQYPELSNREFKTAERIASELKKLGIEVQTKVAHTGVVGVLKGGKQGPVVGLRADIDGLPVVERVPVPYASKEKSEYNGQPVGVMHACGHDTHIAILLGTARVLASMKKDLKGTVKFIFQPAEEGAPVGEEGGAELMVKQGVLKNPDVEVIFGLHISSLTEVGKIRYRPKGTMAASDRLMIKVKGVQTHGAYPWAGVDPIVASAQIIMGLQTIISRQTELVKEAAVVTIGSIHGGVRNNIIPEEVTMIGTIRTLDTEMQKQVHNKIKHTAMKIAESAGAKAEVEIQKGYRVTYNNPKLTADMLPTLQEVAGQENVVLRSAATGAEDFSFYAEKVPGFFFFLGGRPKSKNREEVAHHHTPDFFIDDSGLLLGVKAMTRLTVDYMEINSK